MFPGCVDVGHQGTIILSATSSKASRRFCLDADTADGPLGLVIVERHIEITHEERDVGLQTLQTFNQRKLLFRLNRILWWQQGNSIYFLPPNKIRRRKLGLKAALNIIFFLLTRPYWACVTRESATLRKTFILRGELPLRFLAASSRKTTSRHQCSWFSIDQCFLTELANSWTSVRDVMKYLVHSWDLSPCIITYFPGIMTI